MRLPPARSLSLRTQVALVVALVALLLAVSLTLLLGLRAAADVRGALGRGLVEVAHQVGEEMNRSLQTRTTHLEVLSGVGVLHPPHDAVQVRRILDHLRREVPAFAGVALLGEGGRPIAISGTVAAISSPGAGTGVGLDRALTVSALIRDPDGTVRGLLLAELSWEWAAGMHAAVTAPFARRTALDVVVIDRQGVVLLGPAPLIGQSLDNDRPNASGEWAVMDWPDGLTALTGTAPSSVLEDYPALGWRVVAREPVEVALAPLRTLQRDMVLWGAGLAVVFAALGWLVAGWLSAPLAAIALAADRVRAGQRDDLPLVGGAREIESLSEALSALVHDLLHREAALVEMEDRIRTDPLTGLLNRTGLLKGLAAIPTLAAGGGRRSDDGVACLFIDLDGFKAINDTFGHAAGDSLLIAVGQRLERCLRGRDIIARLGGDEFVMLLRVSHQTGLDEALTVAERAIDSMQPPVAVGSHMLRVGCSIGIALWPDDAASPEDLLQKADEALYEAKRQGRNRACFHPDREVTAAAHEGMDGEA